MFMYNENKLKRRYILEEMNKAKKNIPLQMVECFYVKKSHIHAV